jgi:hypothetical protein
VKAKKKGAKGQPNGTPIPAGWTRKMTPAGWHGESPEKARAMWFAWLRDLDKHCGKMPTA